MSARADALNRLNSNYRVYTEVLQLIAEDPLQKKATHSEAYSLIKALTKLETGFDGILELYFEENKHD